MMGRSNGMSWLGLALELRVLTDPLIKRVEDLEPGQLELFPIDMKTRQRFSDLANTFEACLKNSPSGLPRAKYHSLEFYRYEMFSFVQHIDDDRWKPIIANMLAISCGEPLENEEYLNLIKFFGEIENRALHLTRHGFNCHGGL